MHDSGSVSMTAITAHNHMSVPLEAPAVEMLRGRAPAIDSSGLGNLEFRVLFHVYSFRVQGLCYSSSGSDSSRSYKNALRSTDTSRDLHTHDPLRVLTAKARN